MLNVEQDLLQINTYEYIIEGEPDDLGHYIVPKDLRIPKECWGAICSDKHFKWYKLADTNIFRKDLEI